MTRIAAINKKSKKKKKLRKFSREYKSTDETEQKFEKNWENFEKNWENFEEKFIINENKRKTLIKFERKWKMLQKFLFWQKNGQKISER